MINIEDLMKVKLVVATIISAEPVEDSKKLIKFEVDAGEERNRTVFAGIKQYYDASLLIGKKVVMVANLEPREMSFGTSEGMLLAASSPSDEGVFLLTADDGAKAGMKIS